MFCSVDNLNISPKKFLVSLIVVEFHLFCWTLLSLWFSSVFLSDMSFISVQVTHENVDIFHIPMYNF